MICCLGYVRIQLKKIKEYRSPDKFSHSSKSLTSRFWTSYRSLLAFKKINSFVRNLLLKTQILHRTLNLLLNLSFLAPFISFNSSLSFSLSSSIWSSAEKFYESYHSSIESMPQMLQRKFVGVFNLSSSNVNNFWQLSWGSVVTCTAVTYPVNFLRSFIWQCWMLWFLVYFFKF